VHWRRRWLDQIERRASSIRVAIDGVGLTFLMEDHAAPYLENGQLLRVLEDWCAPFPGYFLYYPSGASSRLRWQPSSTLCACRQSDS
jgi:DNA-binding transcriptional LysR family regulator